LAPVRVSEPALFLSYASHLHQVVQSVSNPSNAQPPRTPPPVEALLRLDDRVAVVTGGGGAIGAAIARRLAEAGAHVGVHYRSSVGPAEALVEDIRSQGGVAEPLQADLTRSSDVAALFEKTADRLGTVSILVNNAGIYPVVGLTEMTETEWDETIDANLKSVFFCTQAGAHAMKEGGSIVNIASIEAERTAYGHSHYNAAKAGVLMHTRSAAAELGRKGIRVNAVSPGLIGRKGIEDAWPDGVERWLKACPLGRLGSAVDVADACLFLTSDASRWISGANLVVDGGTLTGPAF